MIPVPAFDLPPISRALKFADFDRLCARLTRNERTDHDHEQEASDSEDQRHQDGAARASRHEDRPPAVRAGDCEGPQGGRGLHVRESLTDYWSCGPTLLGGYEGEVAMDYGAVPELELEG